MVYSLLAITIATVLFFAMYERTVAAAQIRGTALRRLAVPSRQISIDSIKPYPTQAAQQPTRPPFEGRVYFGNLAPDHDALAKAVLRVRDIAKQKVSAEERLPLAMRRKGHDVDTEEHIEEGG